MTTVGVFGGSGLYQLEGLTNLKEQPVTTPFGDPSAAPMVGNFGETKVVFIPRHGKNHTFLPGEINYRANVYAMKQLGVEWLLSVSAVGSMKEEIHPGHMVVVDQFIDRTKGRPSSFFGDGIVAHVSFGDPVCNKMFNAIKEACKTANITHHVGGTYLCMEGPQFSTRAESNLYRSWGVSIIGMTNIPEAKLAREAEICYGSLAMATDYDCWHEGEVPVTAEAVLQVMHKNVDTAKKVFKEFLKKLPQAPCPHREALKHAIVTRPEAVKESTRKKLAAIAGRYLG